jgi:uncharacterized protein (DUF1330 family)
VRTIDAHGETINTQFCKRCFFLATKTNCRNAMPKAYWIAFYRDVMDADKLAAYAKLAGPAISAGGGRVLARGEPAKVYEHGLKKRTVLIEFDSIEQAAATHDSPAYQAALAALGDGAEREIRLIEGL